MNKDIVCRLCLQQNALAVNLFNSPDAPTKDIEEILQITLVEASHWPPHICQGCHDYLLQFKKYRDKVQNNQNLITHLFKEIDVKSEPMAESDCELVEEKNMLESGFPTESTADEILELQVYKIDKVSRLEAEGQTEDDPDDLPLIRVHSIKEGRRAAKTKGPNCEGVQNADDIEVHMKLMKNLVCDLCKSEEIDTFTDLLEHFRVLHQTKGYMRCCTNKYYKKPRAYDHVRYHLDNEAFKCEDCGKCFLSRQILGVHRRQHEDLPPDLECQECGRQFTVLANLKRHLISHSDTATLKCPQCPRMYKYANTLKSHIREYHERIKPYVCSACGWAFVNTHSLNQHFASHHDPTRKKEPCSICGLLIFDMKKHKRTHHSGVHEAVSCDTCNKQFSRRELWRDHMRRVHKKANRPCAACGKMFKNNQLLKQHMNTHSGIKPYGCYFCTDTFQSTTIRIKHLKSQHSEDYEKYKAAKYELPEEGTSVC